MASAHENIATAIVAGQRQVMGKVADSLAMRVPGVETTGDHVVIKGDGVAAIEALIKEYSAITGPLGVRMCFNSARDALAKHPDVNVPSFKGLV